MINLFHRIYAALFRRLVNIEKYFPPVPPLQTKHIQNCKLITNRYKLLEHIPKQGVCAEIGIDKCLFSNKILSICQPTKFHLVDISSQAMKIAQSAFPKEIESKKIILHRGDSSQQLKNFQDEYFDFIYIDGNHSYDGCKKDLMAAKTKMKQGSLIILNDYIYFAHLEFSKYGVIQAVNEFCIDYDYEIIYMALNNINQHYDIVLRQISYNENKGVM